MAEHGEQRPLAGQAAGHLKAENENLRKQVFRAESVIAEYRQELDTQGFELKKLRAELKLQTQLAQPAE